ALYFDTTETLAGTGTVLFGNSVSNTLNAAGNSTLTLAPGITVQGTSGNLSSQSPGTLVNQGTIAADNSGGGSAGMLTIQPTVFVNQGSLSVSNGETLSINNTWSNSSTATITASGATVNLGNNGSNVWSNTGTITATNSTVNLGGSFT